MMEPIPPPVTADDTYEQATLRDIFSTADSVTATHINAADLFNLNAAGDGFEALALAITAVGGNDVTYMRSDFVSTFIEFSSGQQNACMLDEFPRGGVRLTFDCNVPLGFDAIEFKDVIVNRAQGLAEAGNEVILSSEVREMDRDDVIDTAAETAFYRSSDTVAVSVTPGARVGIDPYTEPAFTQIVNPGEAPSTKAVPWLR